MKSLAGLCVLALLLTGCPHRGHLKPHLHKPHHKPRLKIKYMAADGHVLPEDPVCGRTVDPSIAPGMRRDGRAFFFCSPECLARFERVTAPPKPSSTPRRASPSRAARPR